MPMTFGHIPPDMTLTKSERDADRAAWKALGMAASQYNPPVSSEQGEEEG